MIDPGTGRLAVIGATGFIGRHLAGYLRARGIDAFGIGRRTTADAALRIRVVHDFADVATLSRAIAGAKVIVHLADEAGRFEAGQDQPVAQSLAEAIARTPTVSRLIFASSIYARLDETGQINQYGARKRQQERILLQTGVPAVGLRLPPVYGPGCGGSFAMLDRAARRGLPLPLGRATAPRSFLSISNLCNLLGALAQAPDDVWERGAPALYEPEDAMRISARALGIALARHHGRPARMLPIPRWLVAAVAIPLGKTQFVSGAFDPLIATGNSALATIFDWSPSGGLPDTISVL